MSSAVVCGAAFAEELRRAGFDPVVAAECTAEALEAGVIIVLDSLATEEVAALEPVLAGSVERRCIAVLCGRWDGFAPLPLVAACRGIISGFGAAGIAAAAGQLARQ